MKIKRLLIAIVLSISLTLTVAPVMAGTSTQNAESSSTGWILNVLIGLGIIPYDPIHMPGRE